MNDRKRETPSSRKKCDDKDKSVGVAVLPYVNGLSESLQRIFLRHKVSVSMKPYQTLRNLLVHPKDKQDKMDTCNVVYRIDCQNCSNSYVGETGRKLKTRIGEHKKDVETHTSKTLTRAGKNLSQSELHKSAIMDHVARHNHVIDWDSPSILDKESTQRTRQIREAIRIRSTPQVMNRDQGAYRLSPVYNPLFATTTGGKQGK